MDLSVIIVCYKGWNELTKCLDALNGFTLQRFTMEVIVVDNNSADGRIDDFESKFSNFRFIKSAVNGGYAYGCNHGADAALGEVFMVLNPDTIVGEEEISRLLENVKSHPEYSVISCRQVREDGTECRAYGRFPRLSFKNLVPVMNTGAVSFPDWVSGSMMMMRRDTFRNLNGFDESFWMYYEDVDICLRARKTGGKIVFYNDIVIMHNHGGSSRLDMKTTSITKCEVQASRHLYIHKHFRSLKRTVFQSLIITDNLITGITTGIFGLIFFFIPILFVRFLMMKRLIGYYAGSLIRKSWISPRSVKYKTGNRR